MTRKVLVALAIVVLCILSARHVPSSAKVAHDWNGTGAHP